MNDNGILMIVIIFIITGLCLMFLQVQRELKLEKEKDMKMFQQELEQTRSELMYIGRLQDAIIHWEGVMILSNNQWLINLARQKHAEACRELANVSTK